MLALPRPRKKNAGLRLFLIALYEQCFLNMAVVFAHDYYQHICVYTEIQKKPLRFYPRPTTYKSMLTDWTNTVNLVGAWRDLQ